MTLRLVVHDSELECALPLPPTIIPDSPLYGGAAYVLGAQTWESLCRAAELGWVIDVSGHDFRAVTCNVMETEEGIKGELTMGHPDWWLQTRDCPVLVPGKYKLIYQGPRKPAPLLD